MIEVRRADAEDLRRLPALEAAADELFLPLGIDDLPAPADERAQAWRVLVAGRPVQGFAVLEEVDDGIHLEQLSVHPSSGRRGLGTALLEATAELAWEVGAARVTLLTYVDIPWNAPFYAARGFRVTERLGPELRGLAEHEHDLGLQRHKGRVAMERVLPAPR